ncbi:hypothetical protein BWQ96_04157 [Gracilariopsis chorda]|uniref:Uncharacterized protein n=1 Tax=Gracilariopsis chorda TaxID=448386 RepID=A0A2V3IWG3_9FLOR|nr:hypothetical protein BWQ96_04157 [Gracilariopsis chorda]|eukprot:PXF46057.1 hypothetical protein BWQ96_04157 [Gracilariopsis chorda]
MDADQPTLAPDDSKGRYRLLLEDKVDCIALGDYGSDKSAINKKILDELKVQLPSLHVSTVQPPHQLSATISGSEENPIPFTTSQEISVSITIILHHTNLPVRIHGVPFLVVDQGMDGVLLGRPFLQKIGFDVQSHLRRVASDLHDKAYCELNPGTIKMASSTYRGLRYDFVAYDPIPLPESVDASIGLDQRDESDSGFSSIVYNKKHNGLSKVGQTALSAMLNKYRDVFGQTGTRRAS